MTPLAVSQTPIMAAPIAAAVRPLRPIQALNRKDGYEIAAHRAALWAGQRHQ
jgi:hypothetical protein